MASMAILTSLASIFLPTYSAAPHHQAGDEHRHDDEQQHAVHAGADAADDDLAQLHIDERIMPPSAVEAVMHGVDGAAGGGRRDHGEQGRRDDAEAHLLAFHVAAGETHGGERRCRAPLPNR